MDSTQTATRRRRQRRYEGEDTTPTTERELRGWYSYGMAAEVFAVVGTGAFLPLTLEQLARENGVLFSDRSVPCTAASSGSSPSRLLARDEQRNPDQCLVHVFGADITTSSFAMYTFSIAVLVQALVLVSFSSFADHGDNRKRLLLGFGFAGAITSMSFVLVFPSIYIVAPILVVIGVTCLGSSFVLLNSFLPLLAKNHPDVHQEQQEAGTAYRQVDQEDEDELSASKRGMASKSTDRSGNTPELRLSTRISSKGVGIGYTAAVFVQILSILLLFTMKKLSSEDSSQTLPLRLVLFLAGAWWFAFTIPAALWLRTRPGPPLLVSSTNLTNRKNTIRKILTYVVTAWSSLWSTIKLAFHLKQILLFLSAWFLLSDAVATVQGTAVLFARTELHMETVSIALLSITVMLSGILGSVVWPIISRKFQWKTTTTIITCMLLMESIPIYGLIGYIPQIQSWGVGGLQQPWEIYPLGFVFGIVMGGISSYCRSFFGLLIPPGFEVGFFALYAFTDKGSSAVGPAVVGWIVDRTGRIRPAFVFLAVLVALPVPLVWLVDVEKGREDARRLSRRLRGKVGDDDDEEEEGEGEEMKFELDSIDGRDEYDRDRDVDDDDDDDDDDDERDLEGERHSRLRRSMDNEEGQGLMTKPVV